MSNVRGVFIFGTNERLLFLTTVGKNSNLMITVMLDHEIMDSSDRVSCVRQIIH